jgi:hypothetical protein
MATWSGRYGHCITTTPDDSLILTGGFDGAALKNDVWLSTDKGISWTMVKDNNLVGWNKRRGHTTVSLPDNSIVLMGGYDNAIRRNDVWRSTDNGATWTQMTAAAGWTGRYEHSSVSLADGSIVLMGGDLDGGATLKQDVWHSLDMGATWHEHPVGAPWWSNRNAHGSVAMPDGSIVLMAGNTSLAYLNDVWRSTDKGATWTQMTAAAGWAKRTNAGTASMADGSIITMGGVLWGGAASNDVWRSTDNGATWTQMTAHAGWADRYYIHRGCDSLTDNSILVTGGYDGGTYYNDTWRSTDNGATWMQMLPGSRPLANTVSGNPILVTTISSDALITITATLWDVKKYGEPGRLK